MPKKKLSFEEAVQRIEEIVEILENQEVSLEKSINLYKEGTELAFFCKEQLNEIEKQVTVLQKDFNGKFTEGDFFVGED